MSSGFGGVFCCIFYNINFIFSINFLCSAPVEITYFIRHFHLSRLRFNYQKSGTQIQSPLSAKPCKKNRAEPFPSQVCVSAHRYLLFNKIYSFKIAFNFTVVRCQINFGNLHMTVVYKDICNSVLNLFSDSIAEISCSAYSADRSVGNGFGNSFII